MLNNEQVLLCNRENYSVPKGQERVVHYKIAKVSASGEFIEKPRLVKTKVKLFENVCKRNLELQGYLVEILFHPLDRYTNVRIVDNKLALAQKDAEIARLKAEAEGNDALAEKDAEIARLKAELAKAQEKKEKGTKGGKTAKGAEAEKPNEEKGE